MAAGLKDDELAQVTYISGIDQNGAVASDTFGMYATQQYGFDPPRAYISKWYNDANGSPIAATSTAGTPGGTVTYAFGEGVGVNAQAAYEATLTLWSDVADIQFTQITDTSKAGLLITNTDHGLSDTFVPSNGYRLAGATDLPTQMAPNARGGQAVINIYSPDDNTFSGVTPDTNYVTSTLVHEEGHMLGLGHSGPYNGSAAPDDQFGVYDNAAYSVMSYFNPVDTNAKYYAQYPVYFGSSYASAQTPMMFDILAAQRLYGASTRATFSGGQTYGFNSNIADATKAFYDFNTNSEPFVTIYNSGTNNTLDLSGFAQGSYVNLNPGTFSSASANGDLINNIAIAYNTRIDKAIGGAGDDYFTLNGNGDRIDGGGGKNTVVIQGSKADYVVTSTGTGTSTVLNKTTGTVDTLINIQDIQFQAPVCFTTGTGIRLVRDGAWIDAPVESLRVGDVAVTVTDRFRPIRWIGHRTVVPAEHPVPSDQWPVRIRAGAFGAGLPARDLRLSPGHPVLLGAELDGEGGVLVPVMCLINGTTIAREPVAQVTYWHVELDAHDILLAEGLPAESFLDFGCRAFFAEASDHALHNPDFVPPGLSGRCRPVVTDGPLVEAERRRLDAVFATDLTAHCAWSGLDAFA